MNGRYLLVLLFCFNHISAVESFLVQSPAVSQLKPLTVNKISFSGVARSTAAPSTTSLSATPDDNNNNPIGQAIRAVYFIFSFGLQTVCIALSCGLLLNLCGYAYRLEPHDHQFPTVRIETIQQMRQENQFQQEYNRPTLSITK